jgi:hypothetical protein
MVTADAHFKLLFDLSAEFSMRASRHRITCGMLLLRKEGRNNFKLNNACFRLLHLLL